jgi:hypothetical protein
MSRNAETKLSITAAKRPNIAAFISNIVVILEIPVAKLSNIAFILEILIIGTSKTVVILEIAVAEFTILPLYWKL